ncbi:MAG TPA: hypothetical protein VKX49_29850 [Bryobacteraceae bacterium]|nr:hypothetical protein [Bryobacteraceae bacterium]
MNYFEQFFGIAPDGGNGLTELVISVTLLAIAGFALMRYVRRRRAM